MSGLFFVLQKLRQNRVVAQWAFLFILTMMNMKWRHLRKYRKKLGKRKPRLPPRFKPILKTRGSVDITGFDVFEETGLFKDDFENICSALAPTVTKGRHENSTKSIKCILTLRAGILPTLNWMRDNLKFRQMQQKWGISKSTIGREIRWILPKLYYHLSTIAWPSTWNPYPFEGVVGAIDCDHITAGEFIPDKRTTIGVIKGGSSSQCR